MSWERDYVEEQLIINKNKNKSMTLITTNGNALTLTVKDENFPLVLRTEVLIDLQKRTKEYVLTKTKSGAIAINEKK